MFEDFEFEDKFNPWDVQSLEEFRYYCCPECPSKSVNKTDFIKHAVIFHPESQSVIERLEDNKAAIKTETTSSEATESANANAPSTFEQNNAQNKDNKSSFALKKAVLSLPKLSESAIKKYTKSAETYAPISTVEITRDKDEELKKNTAEPLCYIFDLSAAPIHQTEHNYFHVGNKSSPSVVTKAKKSIAITEKDLLPVKPRHNCEKCAKSFIHNSQLRRHIREEHHGKIRHKCKKCGKSFSLKVTLKRHIKSVHENVRYKCDKCGKSFSLKVNLKRHIKSVHENVRYNCDKCENSFSKETDLNRHIKSVHENVRYNCDMCDKSFSQKASLYTHIQAVHENIRYNCDMCDKSFSQKASLYRHMSGCGRALEIPEGPETQMDYNKFLEKNPDINYVKIPS